MHLKCSVHLALQLGVTLEELICAWDASTHTSKVNLPKVTLLQENNRTAFSTNHSNNVGNISLCTFQIPEEVFTHPHNASWTSYAI